MEQHTTTLRLTIDGYIERHRISGRRFGDPAFRREVETFLSVTWTKAYLLGLDGGGDPSFLARLRKGVSPRLATVDWLRAWMDRDCSDAQRRAIPAAMPARPLNSTVAERRAEQG